MQGCGPVERVVGRQRVVEGGRGWLRELWRAVDACDGLERRGLGCDWKETFRPEGPPPSHFTIQTKSGGWTALLVGV